MAHDKMEGEAGLITRTFATGTTAGGLLIPRLPDASQEGARMAKGLWLRLYAEIIDNRKIQTLTDKQFRWWINLICLAKLGSGNLPKLADIAWKLRKSERETGAMIDALCSGGLLDRAEDGTVKPHDWNEHQYVSDSSTERVRAFRNKNGNVSETFHEAARNGSVPVTETPRARAQSQRTETEQSQSGAIDLSSRFDALYERHPRKGNRHMAQQYYSQAFEGVEDWAALADEIDRAHAVLCESEQWTKSNGQFVPGLNRWLTDRGWTAKLAAPQEPAPVERKWTPEEEKAALDKEIEMMRAGKERDRQRVLEARGGRA